MQQEKQTYKILSTIPETIFRAYDIRGIVGETFTPDNIYTIGLAVGSEVLKQGLREICAARDGRLSGPELLKALTAGLMASGCNVINIGEVPTPILYFATSTLSAKSGVMLTGSHNPPEYNGIKIVIGGDTLYGEAIQNICKKIKAEDFLFGTGKEQNVPLIESYVKRITDDVKLLRPLKIVIDCGNGVGGKVAPKLFRALGCEVYELFCDVDGTFPNHHPDPSILKNLQDLIDMVRKEKADIGLAFDGDADRIGVVTNQGKVILPDRLLMYFALDLLKRHPGAIIPYDVKCTRHLAAEISKSGGIPLMSATGHSLLKAKMKEVKALLAGELSGHIFFQERWYGFDDGLYAAARLLELLSKDNRTSNNIFAALPESINTPELKIAIPEAKKFVFMDAFVKQTKIANADLTTIDGLRADFADGFGLIRASNTSPFLIMRFEGENADALKRIETIFKEKILAVDSGLELPF